MPENRPSTAPFLTLVFAFAACMPASAEVITHWYFGVNYLKTEYELEDVNESGPYFDGTVTINATIEDTESQGWKLYSGYQFSRYLAVEAGFVDLGKYKQTGSFNSTGITIDFTLDEEGNIDETVVRDIPGTISYSLDPKGIEVAGVVISPVFYGFSLRARAGVFFSDYSSSIRTFENVPAYTLDGEDIPARLVMRRGETSSSDIEMLAGVGIDFRASRDWSVGMHWDRYFDVGNSDTGEQDIDILGVDISYHY